MSRGVSQPPTNACSENGHYLTGGSRDRPVSPGPRVHVLICRLLGSGHRNPTAASALPSPLHRDPALSYAVVFHFIFCWCVTIGHSATFVPVCNVV